MKHAQFECTVGASSISASSRSYINSHKVAGNVSDMDVGNISHNMDEGWCTLNMVGRLTEFSR